MAYIGTSPQNGVRNRFVYAATQGQTAFTGADADSKTLVVSDQLYTDVYQNGVKLKLTTDWTASSTTVTLVNAASADDVIEIVSFDVFSVSDTVPASTGGAFAGAISATSYGAVSGTTGTFSGDVAINGASATHPLSVNGQIKSTGANGETLQLQTSSQYSGISFIGSDGTRDAIIDYDHTNGALGLKAHTSSHYINFMTGGYSERFRITDNGVTFNGDTAAANALDDYEEGTWSPQIYLQNSTDQSNASNQTQDGRYTKIGNIVTLQFSLIFTLGSSLNNDNIGVKNFPFTSSATIKAVGGVMQSTSLTSGAGYLLFVEPSGSKALLLTGAGGGNLADEVGSGSGKQLYGSIVYQTG